MCGTYLSNRKQDNSASLFIPSLLPSAWKQVKAEWRFTLVLEEALSACCFASLGLYFPLLSVMSTFAIFSRLNSVESLCSLHFHPHLNAAVLWGNCSHFSSRNTPTKPKHQNTGRVQGSADTVTTTHVQVPIRDEWARFLILSVFCFLGKWYWLYL